MESGQPNVQMATTQSSVRDSLVLYTAFFFLIGGVAVVGGITEQQLVARVFIFVMRIYCLVKG